EARLLHVERARDEDRPLVERDDEDLVGEVAERVVAGEIGDVLRRRGENDVDARALHRAAYLVEASRILLPAERQFVLRWHSIPRMRPISDAAAVSTRESARLPAPRRDRLDA